MLERDIQTPLQEQLADILEGKIRSGEFREEQKLPSLRSLAQEFNVSHETVNAAMGLLSSRGLVKIVPKKGVYVSTARLKTGRDTGFIGLIIDLGEKKPKPEVVSPLYGEFLPLFSQELNQYNYHLAGNYICIKDQQDREVLSNLIKNKIDGLIMCNLFNAELHDFIRDNFYPVASLLPAEYFEEFDQVGIDMYRTYFQITSDLISRGVGSIRILNGPNPHYNFLELVRGVTDACRQNGVAGPDELDFVIASDGWEHLDAERRVYRWLEEGGAADLLLCSNDNLALGALNALQKKGLKVPGDIQVLGGRNTSLCTMVRPQLSSVDMHYGALAKMTVDRLMRRIEGEECPSLNLQIGGHLIERETSK